MAQVDPNKIAFHPAAHQRRAEMRMEIFLALEEEALSAPDRSTLRFLSVNKSRLIADYDQSIFFTRQPLSHLTDHKWTVACISSHSVIDHTSPLVHWLEKIITSQTKEISAAADFKTLNIGQDEKNDGESYPYPHALWIPLTDDAGILFTKETDWLSENALLLKRLCKTYACVWASLAAKRSTKKSDRKTKLYSAAAAIALIAVAFFPVPMTTLAPAEVAASSPQIVSAPINGVIKEITVPPNSFVQKGDILALYVDTTTRNELALMIEEVEVAKARLKKALLSAFSDSETKRDIKIFEAELALAERRRDYALENTEKSVLSAETDGLVLYTDKEDWSGRPVSTGERIMTIANPNNIELHIEAPLSETQSLQKGSKIKLFLDADPLKSVDAELIYSDYYPEPTPSGSLAYHAVASFHDSARPRIGARGVAKIYGAKTPMIFWLLRRPIVAIRQFFGL